MLTNRLTKIKDLIHREKAPNFEKSLDLFSVEDGIITGISGALGIGFEVTGRDLLLEPDAFIEDFERRLRKLLNALPEGATLHFIVKQELGDEALLAEFEGNQNTADPVSRELRESKVSYFKDHPFLKRNVFLFVHLDGVFRKRNSFLIPHASFLFGLKARQLRLEEFTKTSEELENLERVLKEGFRDLGISLPRLNDERILAYLFETLNPSFAKNIHDLPVQFKGGGENYPEEETLRSRLLLGQPESHFSYFHLDQYAHKAIGLRLLPDFSDIKILKDFLSSLGDEFLVSIRLEVPDQDREKGFLRRRSNFHMAEKMFSKSSRHEAGTKYEESEGLLKALAESLDRLFYLSLVVIVKDKSLEACDQKAARALGAFKKLGDAVGLIDDMNHDRQFLSALPLQGTENSMQFLTRSETAVHFLPLQTSWPGTLNTGVLLKNYSGHPVKLDLFDPGLQAKHALMIGTTGSGKSFFTNQLILNFLADSGKRDCIVIDAGGSYKKLARVLGGEYLEVECDEAYAVNPFPVKKTLFPNGTDPDPLFLQFLKEILERMVSSKRALSGNEKMILEKGILDIYRNLDGETAPLLEKLESLLKDWPYGDDEDKKRAYRFSKELVLFTQGEYGKILNRPGRFNIESRFTVFDIRKIAQYPELEEILLLIIPFALRRKFEDIERQKLVILDECWQLLKESQGRDLVEVFYRTSRKYNAGVLSISQNPEDFFASSISGVVINNSRVKYILKLEKGHEALSRFGLNENEIGAIRELEVRPGYFSEVFVKFAEHGVITRYEPSPLEYWISTTDPVDRTEENELRKLRGNDVSEIDLMKELSERYPNGQGKENSLAA